MGSRETIEGGAMASYLTGSMNTFPSKLINLENRPEKIVELEHHLVNLKECFFKVAGQGKTDDQAQEWMKQVRDLFFDIEDWIDEKLETPKQKKDQQLSTNMADPSELEEIKETNKVDSSEIEEIKETNMAGPSELEEEIKETNKVDPSELEEEIKETNKVGPSELEEEIEEKIKGFITLAKEASGRCTRYKLFDEQTTSGAAVARVAPRAITSASRAFLEERTYLIALNRPVEVLKAHLTGDHQTELKVVSIVGTGGLGKTTLAKKIHEELQGKFQCVAFVHVGHLNASIRTILTNILLQVQPNKYLGYYENEHEVIARIWAILSEKRYFVVLDCIWSIRTWRIISCALPDNNLGSRILVTTRMKDVAKSCSPRYSDVVHQMDGLSDDDSKRLFDEKAKTQVDDDVLKMCGGIPLAITMAAGLLTGKYTQLKVPKVLGQHFLSHLEQHYSLSPEMTKILHMSYADLSIPLRSCLLYLSVFPEHYTISKDHLIHIWVAEGFIPRIDDESLWVTGETYFNELISRKLIQPVYDYEDDQAVGCTIQPVILDFIRTLSREENFATTSAELSSGLFLCETIRRFSLDCSNEDQAATFKSSTKHLSLSSIRSLRLFGGVKEMSRARSENMPLAEMTEEMPWAKYKDVHVSPEPAVSGDIDWRYLLLPFKLLRVLDIGEAKNLQADHLKGIGRLIMLRYLRLAPGIVELPEEIEELEQLETLDLRQVQLVHFYGLKVNKLRKLVHILFHVLASPELYIKQLLGMPELEEVSNICVPITSSSGEELRKLLSGSKRLRILGVTLKDSKRTKTQWVMSFLDVLAKSNLDSLSLYCREYGDYSIGILMDSWKKATATAAAKFQPRRFELKVYTERVLGGFPPHMDSLGRLTHLHIATERLEQKGLGILGNMQRLVLLNMSSIKPSLAGRCLVKEGAFPSLVVLSLTCHYGGMGLQFQQGGMPQIRRLKLSFTVSRTLDYCGNFNFGMENLTFLTRIRATINCYLAKDSEVEAAETQAREKVSGHANKPILELCRSNFSRRYRE